MLRRALSVIDPGARCLFVDRGRPGHAHLGVSPSGAADHDSYALANRLVANRVGCTVLELLVGGLILRAEATLRIALTGAPRPVRIGDTPAAMNAPLTLRGGDVLSVGYGDPRRGVGVYTYLSAFGGFVADRVLGSASCDIFGGVGPSPIAIDDDLWLGSDADETSASVDVAPVRAAADPVVLHVLNGPRTDRFASDAVNQLCRGVYTVTPASNRVAIRLEGLPLARITQDELASEGIIAGAVQIPPDGRPIVFGPDHPTTGGYPVLAVVVAGDLGRAAQAQPGAHISFVRARPNA